MPRHFTVCQTVPAVSLVAALRYGIFIVLGGLVQVAPAAEPLKMEQRDSGQRQLTLADGQVEEFCVELKAGERLDYHFDASAMVNFNLHYHQDGDTLFPIKLTRERESGQYFVGRSQSYCMMWTNRGDQPLDINYSYDVYHEAER